MNSWILWITLNWILRKATTTFPLVLWNSHHILQTEDEEGSLNWKMTFLKIRREKVCFLCAEIFFLLIKNTLTSKAALSKPILALNSIDVYAYTGILRCSLNMWLWILILPLIDMICIHLFHSHPTLTLLIHNQVVFGCLLH